MLNNNRVYAMFPTGHPDIAAMPLHYGIPHTDLADLRFSAAYHARAVADAVEKMPPGRRVVFMRFPLHYECELMDMTIPNILNVFENGGYAISRNIWMFRPCGQELRRRGLFLDAIFLDVENGLTFWSLSREQMAAVFASSKARANMPPLLRSLTPENLYYGDPKFDKQKAVLFNKWSLMMVNRALRRVFYDSGAFNLPRKPGGPQVQPAMMNFGYINPSWPVYDINGWPITGTALMDYRTSCTGLYFWDGGRYYARAHHYLWNALIDAVNFARSCMARSDSRFWPTILQPVRINSWLMEQMIAHLARTGVNWTGSRSAYIYFNEMSWLTARSDPILADIMQRHDQPYPRLVGLPEIQLDSDRIETAGFVTTYEDFLANVPEASTSTSSLPVQVMPRRMAA